MKDRFGFRNPWKKLSDKIVYSNDWISVREDQVIRPDGKPGIYGVVSSRVATGVVALTDQNDIHLIGQYRYPTEQYSWEIPEGGAEKDETALSAAKRELMEETGLTADNWIQLGGVVHLSNCHSSEIAYLFLATGLAQGTASPDGTEIFQHRTVRLEEAREMAFSGEIQDAMSIIGIERAVRYLSY